MFTIVYDNDGNVQYISAGTYPEKEKLDYLNYIEVNELPNVNEFRQYLFVENNALVVKDRVLTKEQEKEISLLEYTRDIDRQKEYLLETDYVANKLGEATAKYIVSKDDKEVKELYAHYEEILENREHAREEIRRLETLIESMQPVKNN